MDGDIDLSENQDIKKALEEFESKSVVQTIEKNIGVNCIYVYNLTRKENIAFLGKVGYFGGSLIMIKPKKECDLNVK